MQQYLPVYLEWIREREEPAPVDERTFVAYRSKLRLFFAWLGEKPLNVPTLRAYVDYLQLDAPGKNGRHGQKPITIKATFTAIRTFLDWLREEYPDLAVPSTRKVKLPHVGDSEAKEPDPEDVKHLYATGERMPRVTLQDRLVRGRTLCVLALANDCGLRRCDILPLDVENIRTDTEPWVVRVRMSKRKTWREVFLNDRARKHIGEYLQVRQEWANKVPARLDNPALLATDRSRRIDEDAIMLLRHRLLQLAGLDGKYRLHDFRHGFISGALSVDGVNVKDVQELAGHSNPAITLQYAKGNRKRKIRAVQGLCAGHDEPEWKKTPGGRRVRRLSR